MSAVEGTGAMTGASNLSGHLSGHLADYLRLRRALGFKLGRHGYDLQDFVAFLDAAGKQTVTVESTVAWARKPGVKPITVDFRISAVRGFAQYLKAIDAGTEIPPPGLLSVPRRRPEPHVYSPGEITALLRAAAALRPPLRATTLTTMLALISTTGMRLGEAIALTRQDVALVNGVITIEHAKFDRQRLAPLHPTSTSALRRYALTRDHLCHHPRTDRFFLSSSGGPLSNSTVEQAFRGLTVAVGLRHGSAEPRIHDLRHTFAVRTLIGWQRDGVDISTRLPLLSTYLGHVEPKNTYWYLSAVPELMQLAAGRLEPDGRR
jgi:integrase/recombinase XerD